MLGLAGWVLLAGSVPLAMLGATGVLGATGGLSASARLSINTGRQAARDLIPPTAGFSLHEREMARNHTLKEASRGLRPRVVLGVIEHGTHRHRLFATDFSRWVWMGQPTPLSPPPSRPQMFSVFARAFSAFSLTGSSRYFTGPFRPSLLP